MFNKQNNTYLGMFIFYFCILCKNTERSDTHMKIETILKKI